MNFIENDLQYLSTYLNIGIGKLISIIFYKDIVEYMLVMRVSILWILGIVITKSVLSRKYKNKHEIIVIK